MRHEQIVKYTYLLLVMFIGTIFGISAHYLRVQNSDYSDYFNYTNLESEKVAYEIGEDIYFISKINRSEITDMKYVDILRCDLGEDYSWFSQKVTYSKDLQPGLYTSKWRYDGTLPSVASECYLDSSPTVQLDFGVEKTQNIKTNTFTIGESL